MTNFKTSPSLFLSPSLSHTLRLAWWYLLGTWSVLLLKVSNSILPVPI